MDFLLSCLAMFLKAAIGLMLFSLAALIIISIVGLICYLTNKC